MGTCLDYGHSFAIHKNKKRGPININTPRFEIKSRCVIKNLANNREYVFYQGPTMKSEITFGEGILFKRKDNYNFTPIFGEKELILLRYGSVKFKGRNEEKRNFTGWGKKGMHLIEKKINKLPSSDEIFDNVINGKRIIAKVSFVKNNIKTTLEFPIETINCDYKRRLWQVDTGLVFFPNKIKAVGKGVVFKSYLTYVAFNNRNKKDGLYSSVNFIISEDEEKKDEIFIRKSNIDIMVYKD